MPSSIPNVDCMVDDLESSNMWDAACPNQCTSHDEPRHDLPLACQEVFCSFWNESVEAFVSSVVHRLCLQGMALKGGRFGLDRDVETIKCTPKIFQWGLLTPKLYIIYVRF